MIPELQVIPKDNQYIVFDEAKSKADKIFDYLDISENTRIDYKFRIGLFLGYIKEKGLDCNSFLEFKRYLVSRTDFTVSTKNKYLATAKIFLKELSKYPGTPLMIEHLKGAEEYKLAADHIRSVAASINLTFG